MYIPNHFAMEDQYELLEFMKRFSFATLITSQDNLPIATQLPFLIDQKEDKTIVLKSHFAKANKQWNHLEITNILVIFSEPHAYISPKNYEKELNVPTWNYISVHAYGKGKIISSPTDTIQLLEKTIQTYESEYLQQWKKLPEDYKRRMIQGIVPFEIEITELQGKKKLSQNRTEVERANIINSLSNSDRDNEKMISEYMLKLSSRNQR